MVGAAVFGLIEVFMDMAVFFAFMMFLSTIRLVVYLIERTDNEQLQAIGERRRGTLSRTLGSVPVQQWIWKLMVVVLAASVAALIAWNIMVRHPFQQPVRIFSGTHGVFIGDLAVRTGHRPLCKVSCGSAHVQGGA